MSGRLITLANCALFGSGSLKLKTWKRKSLKLLILRWDPSLFSKVASVALPHHCKGLVKGEP